MAEADGISGAVAGLLADAKAAMPVEGEQLDLLAASQRPSGEAMRWDAGKLAGEVERTAKAGRPKGAQNLATREVKAWVVRLLGGTPQERLARWAMLEPEELAKRLGCSVAEAFDRQVNILKELAPYIMAKVAPVDDQGNPVPLVALAVGGQVAGGDGRRPWEVWFDRGRSPEVVDVTPEAPE